MGFLKKSKSNGIVNLLASIFLIGFSLVVNVSAMPSAFLVPNHAFNHWPTVYLEVAFLCVLFYLGKGPFTCHKYQSC